MLAEYIETSYKEILAFPNKLEFRHLEAKDETTSGQPINYYYPIPDETSLIKRAWETIYQTKDNEVARESRKLLSILQDMIDIFHNIGIELNYLPELYAFNVEDGSVLIEWIFSDLRIGFSIEPNLTESSWFLVTNRTLGKINASGYISIDDPKGLVLWIITYIFITFVKPITPQH